MDKNMESMVELYLFETTGLLEELDKILLDAEQDGEFTMDSVNEIFRIMHTIKGSSAMMEFDSIMTISHRIEDLFFIIREGQFNEKYTNDLFELMFTSTDFLKSEVEKVQNGEPLTDNIEEFQKKISDFINVLKNPDSAVEESPEKTATGEAATNYNCVITVMFEEGCGMENLRAFMIAESLKDVCDDYQYFPYELENNSDSADLIVDEGFKVMFPNEEELKKGENIVKGALNVKTYEVVIGEKEEVAQEPVAPVVEAAPTPSAAPVAEAAPAPAAPTAPKPAAPKPAAKAGNTGGAGKQSLISVNLSKLDKLMDLVAEIVITESMVISSPDIKGIKLDNFTKSARQLRKLTDELQNVVMSVRMVPVAGVFQKMNRIVRDMSHKLGKDVRLEIVGEETEMDKTIVDSIGDPIMHLVRNAMDHGIESDVADRHKYDKPSQGTITLLAEHTGSEVVIAIKDDGKGVDPQKIMEKAKANGILTKPENEYTVNETLMLLMMPGFSTKEVVTEFSGRGVGMDVVKKNVEKVGGVVSISSEVGKGSTITFKIPLTLAIISGMEVAIGTSTFIIPINDIRQSFKVAKDDIIYDSDKNEMVCKDNEYFPILRLYDYYGVKTPITNIEDGMLIWVENGERSYCILVDEILGEQPVVVKPLPLYVSNFNIKNTGIAGCTILGNGNISMILDVKNLYNAIG